MCGQSLRGETEPAPDKILHCASFLFLSHHRRADKPLPVTVINTAGMYGVSPSMGIGERTSSH